MNETRKYTTLSLGAGVQSTVLALLLSRGDERLAKLGYGPPDVAIFADTGWEPPAMYAHLDWLEGELSFPVKRVSGGNLKENLKRGISLSGNHFMEIPLFMRMPDGTRGILRRQCTGDYKIDPITRGIRENLGVRKFKQVPKGVQVDIMIGISWDEVRRMKPSRVKWATHRWPLVDLRWDRARCKEWFKGEYGDRPLPRSACVVCPYHSDSHWLAMKREDPGSWKEAVEFDAWMRTDEKTLASMKGLPYLHRSCLPLDEALASREEKAAREPDWFTNECEGICGV